MNITFAYATPIFTAAQGGRKALEGWINKNGHLSADKEFYTEKGGGRSVAVVLYDRALSDEEIKLQRLTPVTWPTTPEAVFKAIDAKILPPETTVLGATRETTLSYPAIIRL
jgi:hypothetical protein